MSKRRIYLDHASATPLDPEVARAMMPYLGKEFGNPSAVYKEGVVAKKAIEAARKEAAGVLKCRASEIIFTNGATESLNMALFGAVRAWKEIPGHGGQIPEVIVSSIEHEAVLGAARALEKEGVLVHYVRPDERGILRARDVAALLSDKTVIVSVMYANNEIGTIQPVKEIGRVIRLWRMEREGERNNPYPLFHTDACQAGNYLTLDVNSLGVQLLTANAGKLYGPKGIAILYIKKGTPLTPLLFGGGQEEGRRPGTEQVSSIVGMGLALAKATAMRERESKRLIKLRDYFLKELLALPGTALNGDAMLRLPNNVNVVLSGIDNEFFIIKLDREGIAASTKSACKEGSDEASHVILSLGKSAREAGESVRFSLGRSTTKKDIEYVLSVIKKILSKR